MLFHTSYAAVVAALASVASAHTSFTTFFVDDVNQGDGTCVRQPADHPTSTYPIADLTGPDMICGRDGLNPVNFTCPVSSGSKLTFEFRTNPDGSAPGSIDKSHMGPCAVYVKQVDDMSATTKSPSSGWFKIWEEGYDTAAGKWCTEKLITNNGLLSVNLPSGLPQGAYLVRPELLALHRADRGDPQFYVGCAQVLVTGTSGGTGKLFIPSENEATIPGYVKPGDPSVTYNVWNEGAGPSYTLGGPPVYNPGSTSSANSAKRASGASSNSAAVAAVADAAGATLKPSDCLIVNANWCGVEVPSYTNEAGCWAASDNCFKQDEACRNAAPPSGHANCDVWEAKCTALQTECSSGNFNGPPNAGQKLAQVETDVPGPIPAAATRRSLRRIRSWVA